MILIIGYGSLMSRFGIDESTSTRNLKVFNPFIVRFKGIRGFNTNLGHYMDIGDNFNPVGEKVRINKNIDISKNSFECLAYYIQDEDLNNIARREGYPLKLINKIKMELLNSNRINNQNLNIAEFLWFFYQDQEGNGNYRDKIQTFRRNLGKCIGIDILNAHCYFPHPVKVQCLQNNRHAIGLIAIHTDIGAKKDYNRNIRLMTISVAAHSKDPPRKTYFLECILGGVHGINVRDLLAGIDQEIYHNMQDLKDKIYEEWNRTQDWEFHGDDLYVNLKRSGILEYFPNEF